MTAPRVSEHGYLIACGWVECMPGRWRDPITPDHPLNSPTTAEAVSIQVARDRARLAFVAARTT